MQTLLLDQTQWDLCIDINGNIAVASDPYSIAQDVASAIRTFQGECYLDTSLGVPYFQQILGRNIPLSLLKAEIAKAALTVPQVSSASVIITSFKDRAVAGQVQFEYTVESTSETAQGTITFVSDDGSVQTYVGSDAITWTV